MSDATEPSRSAVSDADGLPTAQVITASETDRLRWQTRLWWLTGLCAVIAVGLVLSSFRSPGVTVLIHFQEGHGLKVGDTLHYRGVDVGTVTKVQVSQDMQGVDVIILVATGNESLAVEGSQFWIQRARLKLGQVSGLDTVIGAKYVGVLPGPDPGQRKQEFVGLESPLAIAESDAVEIRVEFPAGEGLEVGDPVRYLGITVGEVTGVELNEQAEAVEVNIRLIGSAKSFARSGTQYWIERPRLDVTEVRGLETLIGGRYVAVQPSTTTAAEMQQRFVGLAEPPPLPRRSGSLEIELDAADRAGLVRGAPITYRGLEVGRVANVNLSSDGATVKVQVMIDAEYADLVRDNSKWWSIQGMQVELGLQGLQLSMDSLSAWLRGGVAFATPDQPGTRVATGHRFPLEDRPNREWLGWQPQIALGTRDDQRPLPKPIRVAASWQASWLGLYRRRSEQTWGLVVDGGRLLVPLRFIQSAQAGQSVNLELAGSRFAFDPAMVRTLGELSEVTLPSAIDAATWPAEQLDAHWSGKSNLLVINPELSEPLALDSSRFTQRNQNSMAIVSGISISDGLAGSPVVDVAGGKVVGLLTKVNGAWSVAFVEVQNSNVP